jgi:DNA-binding Xre family transcriptional regulator
MAKKITSASEKNLLPLPAKALNELKNDYREFTLAEIISAIMEHKKISVRSLAKDAGVSPTIVQEMRSGVKKNFSMESFYKITKTLGFDQFMVGRDGHFISIDLSYLNRK